MSGLTLDFRMKVKTSELLCDELGSRVPGSLSVSQNLGFRFVMRWV